MNYFQKQTKFIFLSPQCKQKSSSVWVANQILSIKTQHEPNLFVRVGTSNFGLQQIFILKNWEGANLFIILVCWKYLLYESGLCSKPQLKIVLSRIHMNGRCDITASIHTFDLQRERVNIFGSCHQLIDIHILPANQILSMKTYHIVIYFLEILQFVKWQRNSQEYLKSY